MYDDTGVSLLCLGCIVGSCDIPQAIVLGMQFRPSGRLHIAALSTTRNEHKWFVQSRRIAQLRVLPMRYAAIFGHMIFATVRMTARESFCMQIAYETTDKAVTVNS